VPREETRDARVRIAVGGIVITVRDLARECGMSIDEIVRVGQACRVPIRRNHAETFEMNEGQAARRLGRCGIPGAVTDEEIRAKAYKVRARLEVEHFAGRPREEKLRAYAAVREAVRCLNEVGKKAQGKALSSLVEATTFPDPDGRAKALKEVSEGFRGEHSAIERTVRELLIQQVTELLSEKETHWKNGTPKKDSIEDLRKVVNRLNNEPGSRDLDAASLRWAKRALAMGNPREARNLLTLHPAAPLSLRAECCEAGGEWVEAARLYEQAGDAAAALRCVRETANWKESRRLASAVGEAVLETRLALKQTIVQAANRAAGELARERVTPAERKALQRAAEQIAGVAAAKTEGRRR